MRSIEQISRIRRKCDDCRKEQLVPSARKTNLKFIGKLIQFFSKKQWFHYKICKGGSIVLNSKHQICGNCLYIWHIKPYQFIGDDFR